MFPNLDEVGRVAHVSPEEAALLLSPAAPIVLLRRRAADPGALVCERSLGGALVCERSLGGGLAQSVAPGSPEVGAMLPYSPLHTLLLGAVGRPVVCTSGNRSEEPIAIAVEEAIFRLRGIADGFLAHDRPIVRPLDDSVTRVGPRRTAVLRRARGYAPTPVARFASGVSVLALGAHLKSTITLAHRGVLVPSQHLGDLESPKARELLVATAHDLISFFDARPSIIACDAHPDYASTALAERLAAAWGARLHRIQHHHAHVAAVMAEHALSGPVLGLAWDGSGLGSDGTVWGGEALVCTGATFERFAHLRPFPLPGGDRAARDPRRCALGLLFDARPDALDAWSAAWFGPSAGLHLTALARRIHTPACSSMGRLFDAVAALVGLDRHATYEGQSATLLADLAERSRRGRSDEGYPFALVDGAPVVVDTRPMVDVILDDVALGVGADRIARRFHETLVAIGVAIARRAAIPDVVLAGGCFQNRWLSAELEERLLAEGFRVHVPSQVPTNDGGISVGQAWAAIARFEASTS
jgi:hydrogenase maturation protein HypF